MPLLFYMESKLVYKKGLKLLFCSLVWNNFLLKEPCSLGYWAYWSVIGSYTKCKQSYSFNQEGEGRKEINLYGLDELGSFQLCSL